MPFISSEPAVLGKVCVGPDAGLLNHLLGFEATPLREESMCFRASLLDSAEQGALL